MADSRVVLPVVVLAGAPAEPELRARYSVEYRAEVPVAGKMIVQHVVDALNASPHVGKIYLVGNVQCEGISELVPPAGSFMENLVAGVRACADAGHALVATSDIPMLTAEAIDDFVGRCGDLDADLYYPIIPKEINERRFPGMRRTYARLAEGTFTGGNVVIISSQFLTENAELIREVLAARKSITRLAHIIGLPILVRAVIAQLIWAKAINLTALESTAGRILNARVKAVQTLYPEIGADVDDTKQLEAIEKLLKKWDP